MKTRSQTQKSPNKVVIDQPGVKNCKVRTSTDSQIENDEFIHTTTIKTICDMPEEYRSKGKQGRKTITEEEPKQPTKKKQTRATDVVYQWTISKTKTIPTVTQVVKYIEQSKRVFDEQALDDVYLALTEKGHEITTDEELLRQIIDFTSNYDSEFYYETISEVPITPRTRAREVSNLVSYWTITDTPHRPTLGQVIQYIEKNKQTDNRIALENMRLALENKGSEITTDEIMLERLIDFTTNNIKTFPPEAKLPGYDYGSNYQYDDNVHGFGQKFRNEFVPGEPNVAQRRSETGPKFKHETSYRHGKYHVKHGDGYMTITEY